MQENPVTFFTASIHNWLNVLENDNHKNIVIQSLRFLVKNERIRLYAFVIMPNHIHLIWRVLPPHHKAAVQRDFLKYTAQQIKFELEKKDPEMLKSLFVGARDRTYQIWQRNAFGVELLTNRMFYQKLDYIHQNPAHQKAGLVNSASEYKYSSIRYYEEGIDDWDMLSNFEEE